MATDDDVQGIIDQLTLDEKAELLGGIDFWRTAPVERLGIGQVWLSDGPHGLRAQPGGGDHLGAIAADPSVAYPPATALASSWDPEVLRGVADAIGKEAAAKGVDVVLGPGLNMKRSPLCGRNFEYLAEDPFLAGSLGAAYVQGMQANGIGSCIKHFAANNQETDRFEVSADIDERVLREIYLPAFEKIVHEANPWTIMCSYNRVNGEYSSQNRWLLTDVLRGEWGFEGLVMSDWGAVVERPKAVHAGLDLEMPTSSGVGKRHIIEAVNAGDLSTDDVDLGVRRVLELVRKAQPGAELAPAVDLDEHHQIARRAATRSAVLLKNDGVLPLDPAGTGSVAVIGELARTPRYQGGGSSQVTPTKVDAALPALQEALGDRMTFAAGYTLDDSTPGTDLVGLRDEALAAARAADQVVLFLGLPDAYESECFDRTHMHLPPQQLALLEILSDAAEHLVVVLSNGSVVEVAPWEGRVGAILEGWLLGQAGGGAVADLLLGVANPSGHLAETIPVRFEDNPTIGNFPGENHHVRYGEGLLIGYRWYDARRLDVAYPFGHGLSYTTFEHSGHGVDVLEDSATPRVRLHLTVTNTGDRSGHEVVQVYVADPESSVFRPEQELKGFATVALEPGEAQRVEIELDARAFAFWDTRVGRWVVEPGTFQLRVGASSRDIRATLDVQLTGEDVVPPLTIDSPVGEWFDHPVAGPKLREAMAAEGRSGSFAISTDTLELARSMPMRRVTRFGGFPATEEQLTELAAQADAEYRKQSAAS